MTKSYLFLFHIGPVQSFIAQARKTRDLKTGSDIISTLVKSAIDSLPAEDAHVVYPFVDANAKSLPNKFLAEIKTDNPGEIGQKTESVVRSKFSDIAKEAIVNMKLDDASKGHDFDCTFWQQIEQHLEIYWVFEEILDNDYRLAHNNVTDLLAAIKNTRYFGQLPDNENNRKCSVSGGRDALVFQDDQVYQNKTDVPTFVNKQKTALTSVSDIQLSKGEGLCAVVAVKRFYVMKGFDSTADIAAMSFKEAIKEKCEIEYDQFLLSCRFIDEGQLWYSANHTEKYLKQNGFSDAAERLPKIREAYSTLMQAAQKNKIAKPTPYYAFLNFDADYMGKIWGGHSDFVAPEANLKNFQVLLARHLHQYAKAAQNYLDDSKYFRGKTVYAGGDDFSGFLNLAKMFDTVDEMRKVFKKMVSDSEELKEAGLIAPITFSAGVVVAHYKTPLSEVVNTCRKAQKVAKDDSGRDAFCITVLKRSGEIHQTSAQWGEGNAFWKHLQYIKDELAEEHFSNTFITSLTREFMGLIGEQNSWSNIRYLVDPEAKRLIQRAVNKQKKPIPSVSDMHSAVIALQAAKPPKPDNFLHALQIADFINRQPDKQN